MFWTGHGCYSLNPTQLSTHKDIKCKREVLLDIEDKVNGYRAVVSTFYDKDFDDYEIIHRWIWGASSCDCVRGDLLYKGQKTFKCTRGRFVLHKMNILGDKRDCVIYYKEFK